MLTDFLSDIHGVRRHTYCLCVEGLGRRVRTYTFNTRKEANDQMYKFMNRKGLKMEKMYDDTHDKTYICNHGVRFYVTRW